MSKAIFDNYIENAFGNEAGQADFKIEEFKLNYSQYLPTSSDAKVLDIGIGRGEMMSLYKKNKINYLGIDISPSTVEHCKKLGLNCELVPDSLNFLKQNSEKYSLITLLDVLEHFTLEYAIEYLRGLYIALKKDGILIVQIPNLQAPDGHLHFFNDVTHKLGLIEHSLSQLLITADIKEFSIHGYENITSNNFKSFVKRVLRFALHKWVKFKRMINGNLNPQILNPVFYAVITKK